MKEEHPCSCESILILLPFVLLNGPRTELGERCASDYFLA